VFLVFLCVLNNQSGKTDQADETQNLTKTKNTTIGNSQGSDISICCPACHYQKTYFLSDGRHKCKQCKKKFTLHRTKARVSADTLKAIAKQFWEMKTAEQCAHDLHINRKTAQNYYSRIRENLYLENSIALAQMHFGSFNHENPTESGKYSVFWFLLEQNQIRIIFPDEQTFLFQKEALPTVQGVAEIYTNSPAARNNIVMDKFYRRTLWVRNAANENRLQDFWRQSKLKLMRYRGGCKSNFPHFITEMAFRINHGESEGAINLLLEKIS